MKINPAEIRTLIRFVTRKTGTPLHDEDLEQDIAVRALEATHRLKHIAYPKALLAKIVRDTVRDHWRRRRTSEDLNEIDERFLSHMPQLEWEVDRRRQTELLRRSIAQLPAPKRLLIELFYHQDFSVAEIARLQTRSISAVKMDLARSRRLLAGIVACGANKKSRRSR
jgi:RNA polymerase sigma factor (sigma-70 family)